MEQINFNSNQQVIEKLINLRNQDASMQNSQTQNVKFGDLVSYVSNNQSKQEEPSNSTTKNNSTTSQALSSGSSAQTSNSHTVRFVLENGIAEYAYVDGIKMNLGDMFLTNKSQLKERIIEKYNKTDAEKLEEIFKL